MHNKDRFTDAREYLRKVKFLFFLLGTLDNLIFMHNKKSNLIIIIINDNNFPYSWIKETNI